MILEFHQQYDKLSDRELIELATSPIKGKRPNEEGVAYLLYGRYSPMLKRIYLDVYSKQHDLYGDCINDLYEYLRSGDPIWNKLIGIEWRSTFGTWLRRTAINRFVEIKPRLIGKATNVLSIDNDEPDAPAVQLPDNGVEDYDINELKTVMMEAISLLKDEDQKFVMIKRLQGYNSKEIAILLQKRWKKHGIAKYNSKKQLVIPDAAYIDVRMQRAKENIRNIIVKLM